MHVSEEMDVYGSNITRSSSFILSRDPIGSIDLSLILLERSSKIIDPSLIFVDTIFQGKPVAISQHCFRYFVWPRIAFQILYYLLLSKRLDTWFHWFRSMGFIRTQDPCPWLVLSSYQIIYLGYTFHVGCSASTGPNQQFPLISIEITAPSLGFMLMSANEDHCRYLAKNASSCCRHRPLSNYRSYDHSRATKAGTSLTADWKDNKVIIMSYGVECKILLNRLI